MSSLLDAANSSTNNFTLDGSLPSCKGEVSIMSVGELWNALENSNGHNDDKIHYDPYCGYNTSTYYVYGICDSQGKSDFQNGSSAANLQAVGLSWYKQLNKQTTSRQTFTNNGKTIFGGPLCCVYRGDLLGLFGFDWYSSVGGVDGSYEPHYWDNIVDSSTYVAVVRAHE